MKLVSVTLFFILVILVSMAHSKVRPEDKMRGIKDLNPQKFEELLETNHVLVEFYAPWCYYSKKFAPVLQNFGKLVKREELPEDVVVGKIDGDKHSSLAAKYKVDGFPTLLFFAKGSRRGKEFKTHPDPEKILRDLKSAAASL